MHVMTDILEEGIGMGGESYGIDFERRDRVHAEILSIVTKLKTGEVGVIAASRTLSRFEHVVYGHWPDLATALMTFVGIASETDALPLG